MTAEYNIDILFKPVLHLTSLQQAVDFLKKRELIQPETNISESNNTRFMTGIYGMILCVQNAAKHTQTKYFHDTCNIVDQLCHAKAQIDIDIDIAVGHESNLVKATANILAASQAYLMDTTIGAMDWESPQEMADFIAQAACQEMLNYQPEKPSNGISWNSATRITNC
jgi:hypothetical protein